MSASDADVLADEKIPPFADDPGGEYAFTFIDLFAGIGGLRLAWRSAGGRCVYSSEWDRFARRTYEANFGEVPDGDITKVDVGDIPEHDVLVGGFPCQPFSMAGRRRGFDDTRGTLFFDVARIVRARRPKVVMLENVRNLLTHDKGRTWQVIRGTLEELGYDVHHAVLDGDGLVPQHRERIVIVAFDKRRWPGGCPWFSFDIRYPERRPVTRDILEPDTPGLVERYTLSDATWAYLQRHAERHRARGNGFGYGIAPLDGSTRTLSARYGKDGSEILVPQGGGLNPRKLTPRECARLQGFPDGFVIPVSNTQAYHQFGNSVVVPLMSQVACLARDAMADLDAGRVE